MEQVVIQYSDLSPEAMVKISELADLLEVPPSRARQIYLKEKSIQQIEQAQKKAA